MDLGFVCDEDEGALEVDVFFAGDGRVCFCCSAVAFFGFESRGEVEGVNCCGLS